jgi:hypothetical protein
LSLNQVAARDVIVRLRRDRAGLTGRARAAGLNRAGHSRCIVDGLPLAQGVR